MKSPLSWAIALLAGGIVLAGYFLRKMVPVLGKVQALVLQWAVMLAALALLIGVLNLLAVHWRKVKAGKSSSIYSVVLIVSLVATIGITAWDGPTGSWSLWILNNIQIPIEASLVALLAIVLAYTAARMFRYRVKRHDDPVHYRGRHHLAGHNAAVWDIEGYRLEGYIFFVQTGGVLDYPDLGHCRCAWYSAGCSSWHNRRRAAHPAGR